jgi:hypothetical protein
MINIQEYKPNPKLTREQLFENNFRYIDGCYSYRFPVCKYKKETTLWGVFIINLETKTCDITVVNNSFDTYPAYHNRTYGSNNNVIEAIDKKIKSQINLFIKHEIITKKNKKRGEK